MKREIKNPDDQIKQSITMEATEDQLILATGGYDHTIKVWQAHTGNCIKTMRFVETSVSGARRLLMRFPIVIAM